MEEKKSLSYYIGRLTGCVICICGMLVVSAMTIRFIFWLFSATPNFF